MNDEVSVAELLIREGWGDQVPPPTRSRWRVIAVMVAVVAGCGAAALLVQVGTPGSPQAEEAPQIGVIHMPDRTDGAGGADESAEPPSSEAGSGGGTGDRPSVGGPGPAEQTTHQISPATTAEVTSAVETTATPVSQRDDPPSGGSSSPPPSSSRSTSHPPSPPPPPTREPCFLVIIC
ncbi:hypothetical protein [Amycolatopsis sp. H20-H5]|uniref:hypothetical protein n=1 Tax=Amycolatopsis sp. H20-H5 TaxID=3046309 RepID=UPI002DBEECC1|nr:hypothetical protein [Amycolatopsis sp. H20-H5]MEC3975431.1 hypothetical protein [Amycolatopsis sp. H20-H5]